MSTASPIPSLTLNDGRAIPQLGFGTWQVPQESAQEVVALALAAGYRHLDTAQMYGNEAGVGAAIAASGLPREEIYLTTKLNNGFHRPDDARRSLHDSLERLGTPAVDLFLIHWPLPTLYHGDFVSTWQTLEALQAEGLTRSIGVSNFQVAHLERLARECEVVPAVNQIERHPYFLNREVVAYGAAHGIVTEAWSPLAQGRIASEPVAQEIGARVGATASQVTLRWHLQHGHVIFPKSSSPERIAENAALFGFTLSPQDMAALDALDQGTAGRIGPDPDTFAYVPS